MYVEKDKIAPIRANVQDDAMPLLNHSFEGMNDTVQSLLSNVLLVRLE